MQETQVQSLGWEDPLEKEMATHSSILAWRIPWTEEPGGLQSTRLQRVGHDWVTSLSFFISLWWLCCRKGDPFQGLKLSSCLTLGNELSEETHLLTKQEILLGKGTWVESSRVKEHRRTALGKPIRRGKIISAKAMLKENNKVEELTFPKFQTYKATVMKTV